jgi:hypothetical protein
VRQCRGRDCLYGTVAWSGSAKALAALRGCRYAPELSYAAHQLPAGSQVLRLLGQAVGLPLSQGQPEPGSRRRMAEEWVRGRVCQVHARQGPEFHAAPSRCGPTSKRMKMPEAAAQAGGPAGSSSSDSNGSRRVVAGPGPQGTHRSTSVLMTPKGITSERSLT